MPSMSYLPHGTMSPLALYIDQVSNHVPASPSQHPKVTIYPLSPQKSQIFASFRSAPTLDKVRTNRVLIYPGSFNPPHRGHLHLLKHVFMHGAHDLNVIAAIILPGSDESVGGKVRREGGYFMFGRDTRGLLWKQDLCFPPWAWVYEGKSFTPFLQRLSQATEKDGYSLEYVPLYGPQIGSPSNPPDPAFGCKTIIMSDAARRAEFQRSSGRLRDFSGCTEWRRVHVDEDELRWHAKAKAKHALQAMKTIKPLETLNMLIDGMRGMDSSFNMFKTDLLVHRSRLREKYHRDDCCKSYRGIESRVDVPTKIGRRPDNHSALCEMRRNRFQEGIQRHQLNHLTWGCDGARRCQAERSAGLDDPQRGPSVAV